MAFTDPGTVLDHFLVVYFIRKHFFSGEIGPDWPERVGFRRSSENTLAAFFPVWQKNSEKEILDPTFSFLSLNKGGKFEKTQMILPLLAKKGLNAIKLCINRVHSGPRPSTIVPPRSFVARGNKYLGLWAHLFSRLIYNQYVPESLNLWLSTSLNYSCFEF